MTEPPPPAAVLKRIGFFGGSFNPPHIGHVLAVTYVLATAQVDEVWVVPVYEHAFGKPLESFEHRAEMARLAMQPVLGASVCLIERELPVPSYTLRSIQQLTREHPSLQFRLIVGTDAFAERHEWHQHDELLALAPALTLARITTQTSCTPEHDAREASSPAVLPCVSSTSIREWLAQADSLSRQRLQQLVPQTVLEYIERFGLYR